MDAWPAILFRDGAARHVPLDLASISVTGGLLASASLSGVLRNVLFGVSPDDPLTYALVACGFLLLAVAASALPTLRALHVDPIGAIRTE